MNGGASFRLRVTRRSMARIVTIGAAIAATAMWLSVASGDQNPYSRAGIGATILTGLLALMLPLALRANRAAPRRADDGARIVAVAATALIVIGSVTLTDHYAVAARFGDGTRGSVEVDTAFCADTCTWSGIFWVRQHPQGNWAIRRDWATLTDNPDQIVNMKRHYMPAIDVGDSSQLYPLNGGPQWAEVRTTAITTTTAASSLIAALLVLSFRRSRRHRRTINAPALVARN